MEWIVENLFQIFLSWLILGIVTAVLAAYDPYNQEFDWTLSEGWFPIWFSWTLCIICFPVFLPRVIYILIRENKYVKEWRTKGSFTRKLK